MTRLAFVTSEAECSIASDDLFLRDALVAHGIEVVPWVWRAKRPLGLDAVVMRSCWDYHEHAPEFLEFLGRLEQEGMLVWNPVQTLRWNLDKRYLRDLESYGASIPRTVWCVRGETRKLETILASEGLDQVVVKPRVSLSAHDTFRTSRADADRDQGRFLELVSRKNLLVQEFVSEIAAGEVSLVFIDGTFSHAVRKVPADGDFRVQTSFGGVVSDTTPAESWIAAALNVLQRLPPLLYARIDVVPAPSNVWWMELEALDPVLFFKFAPHAAGRLASAIKTRLLR